MTDEGRPELQTLTGMDCYRLLATQQVGRLGDDAGHYPLIFPVNYVLDRDVILVRTRPGTKLSAADDANVTFEVDDIDRLTHSGWSVLMRGHVEDVTSAYHGKSLKGTRAGGPEPWAPGEHGRWVRIVPHGISGRRIMPGDLPVGPPATSDDRRAPSAAHTPGITPDAPQGGQNP